LYETKLLILLVFTNFFGKIFFLVVLAKKAGIYYLVIYRLIKLLIL